MYSRVAPSSGSGSAGRYVSRRARRACRVSQSLTDESMRVVSTTRWASRGTWGISASNSVPSPNSIMVARPSTTTAPSLSNLIADRFSAATAEAGDAVTMWAFGTAPARRDTTRTPRGLRTLTSV